jgi:hypothetical protein
MSRQNEWQHKQTANGCCRQCGFPTGDDRTVCIECRRPDGLNYRVGARLEAHKSCAQWLQACLKLGWPKSSLDRLQRIWWKFHDVHGNLIERERGR